MSFFLCLLSNLTVRVRVRLFRNEIRMPCYIMHRPDFFLQRLAVRYLLLGGEEYPAGTRCAVATVDRPRPAVGCVLQGRIPQDALHAK